ncbi:MAG TPA: hypothetical protein VGN48_08875 [Pedococcus sp.]|nr:hypothetical protein [Pedococcus sp.]
MSDEWDERLTEDEQNLAVSLANLTSVRYGAVVTESARIRRRQVESGGGPEEPAPRADADPGTQPAGGAG